MTSATAPLTFTIDPARIGKVPLDRVVSHFSAQLLAEQATYDWNGILDNALRNAELPAEMATTVTEEGYDDALTLHTLLDIFQEGLSWVTGQRQNWNTVPLPNSIYEVATIHPDDEMDALSYDPVALLIEVADTIPGFGQATGMLGSGIFMEPIQQQ